MDAKTLSFATQIMVMAILISVALLFIGIGVLVLIHVCVVGSAFSRGFSVMGRPHGGGRRGLSRDEVERLPCFEYKPGEMTGGGEAADCAVCLETFQAGDSCRLLPACRHSFHAACVDSWFLKSSMCPICRASVDAQPGGFAGDDASVETTVLFSCGQPIHTHASSSQ